MSEPSCIEIDRIVEMAWEDRTPFEAIHRQFNLRESEVISLMRKELRPSSFRRWRRRVQNRDTKHLRRRSVHLTRFRSSRQRSITQNRIAKRT